MDSEYLKVSPFKISDNHYLFFDIFYKNDLIYIIAPFYHSTFPDFSLIQLFQGDSQLELVRMLSRNSYEPTCVLIYKPSINNEFISVNVRYDNIQIEYNLKHYQTTKTDQLIQTTLCLHDIYLLDIYYEYHRKIGVQKFYMYYNGVITDDIKNKFNKENIFLIEWNFHYWNPEHSNYYKHHAQPGQIQHALYKYGKDSAKYMLFNDLDEYVYIKNDSLQNLLLQNPDYIFLCNAWSKLSDNSIPSSFPKTFLTTTPVHHERSKCIYNTDSVELLFVHYFSKLTDTVMARGYIDIRDSNNISRNNILIHFCNWSQPKRRVLSKHDYYEITI
jgi:hypothetical protein